jgi:peptidoglycan/LPS O-acetylase OafA/YrhL
MEQSGVWQPWLVGRIVLMLLVIAVSTASFNGIEKPAQRWLQRVFARWLGAGGAQPAKVRSAEAA